MFTEWKKKKKDSVWARERVTSKIKCQSQHWEAGDGEQKAISFVLSVHTKLIVLVVETWVTIRREDLPTFRQTHLP